MRLSIITINFRKPSITLSCIASVYASCTKQFEEGIFEMLVIDNFSEDNSFEILKKEIKNKKYKNVSVLAHDINNGFGGGNNFGEKSAKGEYLLFLNNDTLVQNGIVEMLSFLENSPQIGILGGVLENTSGTQQHSYDTFYSLFSVIPLLLGIQRFQNKKITAPMRVDWVKGACLMIQREFFKKLNGFDEHIFMYAEDMELCFRVKQMGKQVWIFPSVTITHANQGSSNRTFAIVNIYKGILYFYKKHKSPLEFVLVKLLLQTKAVLLLSYGKLTKKYLSNDNI